jgi:hypothetical protein
MDERQRGALQSRIDTIVQDLEKHGVKLNRYGNVIGEHSLCRGDRPNPIDAEAVHEAMNDIPHVFRPCKTWKTQSYGGKGRIEHYRRMRRPDDNYYVSNGDFIVAMLLLGFEAKWRVTRGGPTQVNCMFKATNTQG